LSKKLDGKKTRERESIGRRTGCAVRLACDLLRIVGSVKRLFAF
jgi:hypothetical protein